VSSVKEHVKVLVALQKIEIEIRQLEADLSGIDERIDALSEELLSYQKSITEQEEKLADIKKTYRSNEAEVQMIEVQIGKSKEKLGAVKTNKEYQSMLKEIDELKEKSSGIEDQMLADLDRLETYEKDLVERKADLVDAQSEIQQKQEEINQKAERQKAVLGALRNERNNVWETLDEKNRQIYEKVKRQGNGIAIAAIVDGICQVCRINIPPQLYNELQRMDALRMCPNCQRIMYPKMVFEEEHEA
jgi:uncharacterized protein